MVKYGIPIMAIKLKMKSEGFDENLLDVKKLIYYVTI